MRVPMSILARMGLVLACTSFGVAETHAPWPADWNNWNDPRLWVRVGNPGNSGELSGLGAGGNGPDRICGAVVYEFRMGKFEVTAGQYTAFLNAVAKTDTYGLYSTSMTSLYGCHITRTGIPGSYLYSVADTWANRPVDYVSWGDAVRFANWLTNGQPTGAQSPATTETGSYALNGAISDEDLLAVARIGDVDRIAGKEYFFIPTEDEWYKAAYHKNDGVTGNYWFYPTGTDDLPSNVLVDPDPGNNANYWYLTYTIGDPYYKTNAGEFENSASPYGTFDQGGNVYEWNEAILAISHGLGRGMRGGQWLGGGYVPMRASFRNCWAPSAEGSGVGFRIAEVPEPGTLSLLCPGGLAVMRRRRK